MNILTKFLSALFIAASLVCAVGCAHNEEKGPVTGVSLSATPE